MQVTITAVNTTQAPKGYKIAEVKYLREGKEETRKLMSFTDEALFTKVTTLTGLPVEANIVMKKEAGKDGKEYWNWKGVEVSGPSAAGSAAPQATSGKVLGSNYETPAERAKKQVYIVRQSSVSSAIEYYKGRSPKGIEVSPEEIISTARVFESYVFDANQQVGEPE